MTSFLHLRARRFQALHDLLTGAADPRPVNIGAVSDYLSHDLGLPERPPQDRRISHLDLFLHSGKSWRQPSKAGGKL